MGKACVITDVGAVREYLKDAALIVKQDEKSIGEGINKLIENPETRNEYEKKARKLFEEEYSVQASVEKLEKIYLKIKNNQ